MRNLHTALKRDRHLKHFGRLQYGLFLKVRSFMIGVDQSKGSAHLSVQVLGLSIDEAITFWRRGLSTVQDDKFNKEYKYNIRHSYGLEGKRANYPAKRFVVISNVGKDASQLTTIYQLPTDPHERPTELGRLARVPVSTFLA